MKYTHYNPNTGERGNLTRFSTYNLTKDKFEQATGLLVKDFTCKTYRYMVDVTYNITLHTGEKFIFDNCVGSGTGSVFHSESGKVYTASPKLPQCSPDERRLFRVYISMLPDNGSVKVTPFFDEHAATEILTEISLGQGAFFKDDHGQLTVIPNHNISKAVLIESPYGGRGESFDE